MIDLETQTSERIKILWEKFEHLEQFLRLLSPTLKRIQQRLSGNPDSLIRKSNNLAQESRECRALIESQKNLLAQMRNETQQLLNIYGGFGLSFPVTDPCQITKDLDLKMEELIIFIQNLVQTVRLEIPDKTVTGRIFGKMQELISTNALVNQWVDMEDDEETLKNRVLDR